MQEDLAIRNPNPTWFHWRESRPGLCAKIMDPPTDIDQRQREIQREYLDFLDDGNDQGIYVQKVRDMIANNEVRLIVNINDLRRKNPTRAASLLKEAFTELIALQRALKEFVASADPIYSKQYEEFFVGFVGSFGAKHVSPRTLTSRYLGNLVCVEGIVTKCSLIRPKMVRSVHYCPATTKTMERKYTDMTSLDAFPSSAAYPTKDEDGNLLETEYGLSTYKDHQTFSIQEMPEKAPAGQLPRSVDIIADNDLVDILETEHKTILLANNIQQMSKEVSPTFSADDVAKIKKFSRQKGADVFDVLGRSLAPSIHGHEYIKKAVLCMLLGGTEKVLANGTRLRGDINVLLIGDPSVAKSQMLRYVLHTAPRAVTTTGRGSSGVGLTAAVTTDQETGERRLEAGAMVLADRGVVCIDEFDKMSDLDRTAIHEVMEQGRVTIAKAGIHAKLNARCSVLAAANPVYGRDSLLSRFDLIFIVLDKMDPELDRNIADFVLRMHRYRGAMEQDGDVLPLGTGVDMLATTDPDFEGDDDTETPVQIVSMQFMRKYIHVAKALRPTLTQQAATVLSEEYSKLRSHDSMSQDNVARTTPVTARTLETMIRLATAHAKCRLSKTVDLKDAEAAVELIEYAYFKKVEKKQKKRRHSDGEDTGESSQEEEESSQKDKPKKKKREVRERRPARKEGEEGYDPYDFDEDEAASADEGQTDKPRRKPRSQEAEAMDTESGAGGTKGVDDAKLKTFRAKLFDLFKNEHAQSVSLEKVKGHMGSGFSEDEVFGAIERMMDANQVMLADDVIISVRF
ncbi:MCM3Z-like protein [Mya arenaria]|uniref:DNA replication licensing factor MCM3 n=1 Tax=Mya arenaria TaxID=6604 RepID=A0ABY7F5J0_MYAAR|nr:MCM3Z-like protein [Mya arenaria]